MPSKSAAAHSSKQQCRIQHEAKFNSKNMQKASIFPSLVQAFYLIPLLCTVNLIILPLCDGAVLNSYRSIGMMQNNGGSRSAAAFFGQSIPSIADRRAAAAYRELHRRDTEMVKFGRLKANANSEVENVLAEEMEAAPSRMPRANNGKLARKNCFFSPLQCSFYYKSNSNFANMLIGGEEH